MNVVFRFNLATVTGIALTIAAAAGMPAARAGDAPSGPDTTPALPERLSDTGLFVAGTKTVRPGNLPYTPQYPLWSDGAAKRRWLYVPPGTTIDASRPDEWEFPPGTRLWKEFSHGQPVETRLIERLPDGSWRYATYVWDADANDATLAPVDGIADLPVAGAPNGRYTIPSRDDCLACHEGSLVPVLGVTALQLSPDRDPRAPHAEPIRPEDIDLRELAARGLLSNLPPAMLEDPPRIAARSPAARSALGYLHANCGHCHNEAGPLGVLDMVLAQEAAAGPESADKALRSLVGQPSEFREQGVDTRIVPGRAEASVLPYRMRSRDPLVQMPPLGTQITDIQGLALIERWIQEDLLQIEEVM